MELLEEKLQKYFLVRKLTLSIAESCTGGAVAARLVKIPECSQYFLGGIVAYSNLSKSRLLGVSPLLLKKEGAVSLSCAREMARGAKRQFGSDVSLAITGIAGPSGGSEEKPVGTVCFALSGFFETEWSMHFRGSREEIIAQSVQESILKLCRCFSNS